MALPLPVAPIEIWASSDYILPNTHNLNKKRPIDDLWLKGYDMRQKPTVEDFNYLLNMVTSWVKYVIDGALPEFKEEIRQELEDFKNEINILIQDFRQEINNQLDAMQQFLIPVGAMMMWGSVTPPSGWLELNGQSFDTATNPKLASIYPSGRVPDFRGRFVRAWAHGSTIDTEPNRALNSIQRAMIEQHKHISPWGEWFGMPPFGHTNNTGKIGSRASDYDNFWFHTNDGTDYDGVVNPAGVIGSETRPHNIAVMYIIKTDKADATPGQPVPTGIVVTPATISGAVGYTRTLSSQVLPSNLAPQYPVTYTSADPTVATVSTGGLVTLVGPGTTNIIVSISTGLATIVPVTSYRVLTSITLSAPTESIRVNESYRLSYIAAPVDFNEPLSFVSNNTSIATVNSGGEVMGMSVGTALITVTGTISGVTSSTTVTIVPAVDPNPIPDAGEVGSLAYCKYLGTGSDPQALGYGATISGTLIAPASMAVPSASYARVVSTVPLTGTWRCLGYISRAEGASEDVATLFQRIS